MKIVICGSMRFYPEMVQFAKTLDGLDVELPDAFKDDPNGCPDKLENPLACVTCERRFEEKEKHLRRIRFCDMVILLNPTGHVGNDSFGELCVADYLDKPIYYTEEPTNHDDTDRLAYVRATIWNQDNLQHQGD